MNLNSTASPEGGGGTLIWGASYAYMTAAQMWHHFNRCSNSSASNNNNSSQNYQHCKRSKNNLRPNNNDEEDEVEKTAAAAPQRFADVKCLGRDMVTAAAALVTAVSRGSAANQSPSAGDELTDAGGTEEFCGEERAEKKEGEEEVEEDSNYVEKKSLMAVRSCWSNRDGWSRNSSGSCSNSSQQQQQHRQVKNEIEPVPVERWRIAEKTISSLMMLIVLHWILSFFLSLYYDFFFHLVSMKGRAPRAGLN